MAQRKVKKGLITAPEAPAAEGADDLQKLHPNLEAPLNGRIVVVREYGFVEGLLVRQQLKPFLDGLYELIKAESIPPLEQIMELVVDHLDAVLQAVATSADIDIEELKSLENQEEGDLLLMRWWTANGPFFYRRAQSRILAERFQAAEAEKRRAGQTSTPASSAPDTATSSG
ncbi:DUF6631 family protein [Stutzerimonas stutzeri]|uniref:DUF6631 family protein n=1 Tax=Stutzerimonas stutzeri TaxID=316 RepID=UPI001BCC3CC6|nr:DUF6631 family protein [Stutzerimonas stutzeri]